MSERDDECLSDTGSAAVAGERPLHELEDALRKRLAALAGSEEMPADGIRITDSLLDAWRAFRSRSA